MHPQVSLYVNGKELFSQDTVANEAFELIISQSENKRTLHLIAQARDIISRSSTIIAKATIPSGDHIQIGHYAGDSTLRRFNQDEIEKLLRLHPSLNPEGYESQQLHIATKESNFIIRTRNGSDITCFYEAGISNKEQSPLFSVGTLSQNSECEQWMKKTITPGEIIELIYIAS
ncbi:hypothetical protein [Metapseudomonas otitidis]|uniref:hypothetical protein n=1 Tax=Metapseudomonas otitidis TaxID=319939 RepID=UPI0013F61FB2|nr:hypothetical protein [Pseudomonas otitidis]